MPNNLDYRNVISREMSVKTWLPFGIIAITFLGAAGGGFALYCVKKQRIAAAAAAQIETARRFSSLAKQGANPPHARGPTSPRITLEEFGDFQCRPCGDLSDVLAKLAQDYSKELRLVFREFPMPTHRHALDAARAAEAAGLQERFWEMHDLLYRNRFIWPQASDVRNTFSGYAALLGLDVERFNQDMAGAQVKERIAADQLRGRSLGVDRTPTIYLNDRAVPASSFNPPALHSLIDHIIGQTK